MAIDPYSAANSDRLAVFGYESNNLLPDGDYNPSQPDVQNGFQYQSQSASSVINTAIQQTALKVNHNLVNGIPQWNATTPYQVGAAVQKDGVWYRAIQASTDKEPKFNNDYWEIASSPNLTYINITSTNSLPLNKDSNSKFIDCEFQTNSNDISINLPTDDFSLNFYCELFIRNNLNTPINVTFSASPSAQPIYINNNNTSVVTIPPKNSGSVIKILWGQSAGGVWYIYTPITATNTDYGLVTLNQLQNIVQGVLDSEFNSAWPVGSVFPAIQNIQPPKQGQTVAGVQVNWTLVSEGSAVMSGDSSNVGQVSGTNRLDTGYTAGHAVTIAEMPRHAHRSAYDQDDTSLIEYIQQGGLARMACRKDDDAGNNGFAFWGDGSGNINDLVTTGGGRSTDAYGISDPHDHEFNVKNIKLMLWQRVS